jgi:hypothetical protein
MKLHEGLWKVDSSLAIQLRTGTNSLDAFLFQARVPSVTPSLCSCGRGQQMAKHILIFCSRHAGVQHKLRDEQGHRPDFSKSLGTAKGLQKIIRWVMHGGIWGSSWGPGTRSMALSSPSSQHKTDFGIALRYWRLQGTLQKMH